MENGLVVRPEANGMTLAEHVERALITGDLSQLTPEQRVELYNATCRSLGLNPLTKPFEYIELNGRLVLYAKRDCTDQLRASRGISVTIINRETVDGVYVVTARASTPDGRADESIGAVPIVREGGAWKTSQSGKRFFEGDGVYHPLKPEDKANAIMKAETKAKRRVTLSICGLGILDESELDTIREAAPAREAVDDVAQRRMAEEQAKLAAAKAAAKKADGPPDWHKQARRRFLALEAEMTSEAFQAALGAHGYTTLDELLEQPKAEVYRVGKEMAEELRMRQVREELRQVREELAP